MNTFRRTIITLVLLVLALPAFAQNTVTVTGDYKDLFGANVAGASGQTFVRFRLENWTGNVPRVSGVGIISKAKLQTDTTPDATGHFSATVYGNDSITPGNTYYEVQFWQAGTLVTSGIYQFTQVACPTGCNLDTYAQLTPAGNGTFSTTPQNTPAVAHEFFTAFNNSTGAFTLAQPSFADISGQITGTQLPSALPANTPGVAHEFFTAFNSTTGAFTLAQPASTDLSDATSLVKNNAANTGSSAMTFNLAALSVASGLTLPTAAGAAPTTAGVLSYDSTAAQPVFGNGSATGHMSYYTGTTPTSGHCAQFGANGSLTDAGSGCTTGGGNVNTAAQYSMVFYSGAGVANTLSGIAPPTTPPLVPEFFVEIPTAGGAAQQPSYLLSGVSVNPVTGNYTVAATDRTSLIVSSDATADTDTVPDPTTSAFGSNFTYLFCNSGSAAVTENRSGTSLLNGATSYTIPPSWCSFHYSDNTNFKIYTFPTPQAFPDTGTSGALTYSSTTGSFGNLPNIVTQNGTFTAGDIPAAFDGTNLKDGYPVLGTDANIPTISGVNQNQPVCGDANNGLSPCTVSGQSNYPVSYQTRSQSFGFSLNAVGTVSNTTTSTTLLSSFEGNQTILAGTMIPGGFGTKTIRISGKGGFSSVSTPNLTLNVVLGGTTLVALTFNNVPATGHWTLDLLLTVVDLTDLRYGGCFTYVVNGSSPISTCVSGLHGNVNFAVDQVLDVQAAWSVASASNTITADVLTAFPVQSM